MPLLALAASMVAVNRLNPAASGSSLVPASAHLDQTMVQCARQEHDYLALLQSRLADARTVREYQFWQQAIAATTADYRWEYQSISPQSRPQVPIPDPALAAWP